MGRSTWLITFLRRFSKMKLKPKCGVVPWFFDHQCHIALAVFILLSATIKSLHHCIPAVQGFVTSALETTGLIVTGVTIIVNVSDVLTESGKLVRRGRTMIADSRA
jgi:hypothetical protein